jgi:AcrR family transcriptional regulator
MARPQSPDYDKRREAIVSAAARLYALKGFKGASVADLAEACRTSKSLIYHYFPSKEDILYDVMASHLELLAEAAEEATVSNGSDPRERLQTIAHSFMRLYSGAADRHRVLLNELDNLPAERRADVIAKQRRIVALVESQIREVRPDLASGAQARALTMLFFGMINWTHTWFKADGEMPAEALGELAVDLMLNGLAGLDPQAS